MSEDVCVLTLNPDGTIKSISEGYVATREGDVLTVKRLESGVRMRGHRETCASLDVTGVKRACNCGTEA